MSSQDFRQEAAAALEARKELGPDYDGAIVESFADRVTDSINHQVDARLDQRLARLETLLAKYEDARTPQREATDAHVPVALFSLIFGVGGSIWLSALNEGGPEFVLVIWLGIMVINIAFALRRRPR